MACFCEDDDVLTQWHGYGNKGTGYAIGFDGNDLTQIVPHLNVIAGRVQYGEEKAIQGLEAEMLAASKAVQDTLAKFSFKDKEKEDLSILLSGQVLATAVSAASFVKKQEIRS